MTEVLGCCACLWILYRYVLEDIINCTFGTDEKTAAEQEAFVKQRYQLTDEQYRSRAWFEGDWKHRGAPRSDGSRGDWSVVYLWWWFAAAAFIAFGLGWRL